MTRNKEEYKVTLHFIIVKIVHLYSIIKQYSFYL